MFAPKNHASRRRASQKGTTHVRIRNYTSRGKKQSFSVEKMVQVAEQFVHILPTLAGVTRHCGQNTAPEKPAAKLLLISTKHHPLYLQTKPQVVSIISIYRVLGKGLAFSGGAAEGSAPQQQWVSCSCPMPQLWFSRQPG